MNILSLNSASYYFYNGSLTTPPCTEGVNWIILNSTIGISNSQLDIIQNNLMKKNSRISQNLNNRKILTYDQISCQQLILNSSLKKELKNNYLYFTFINFITIIILTKRL
jgi:hypothetical protein